jgi:hypothetical protein
MTGKYRCVHCGDRFDIESEEEEYLEYTPDTCQECCDMINHPPYDIEYSDADPGL